MKNNVIDLSIPFYEGSIKIIGLTYDAAGKGIALISAVSLELSNFSDPELQVGFVLENGFIPDFCGKCLTSINPEKSSQTIMVFEYSFKGELRNPKKFLKSLRNKLKHEILWVQDEVGKESEYRELMNQGGLTMAEAQDTVWPHP